MKADLERQIAQLQIAGAEAQTKIERRNRRITELERHCQLQQAQVNQAVIPARVQPKPFLKKLDYFGNPGHKKVNVVYPTESIFAKMPPGVRLKSIEFSTWSEDRAGISGTKCTYSNELESPLFKKD